MQTLDLKVDTAAPISKGSVDTAARTVGFVAADETSGVDRVESRIGTSGEWAAGTTASVGAGETVVQFRAIDTAGNAEDPNTVTVPAVGQGLNDSVTVASLSVSKVRYGSTVSVTAKVNGSGPTPGGAVRVLAGETLVGTGTLVDGRTTIAVKTADLGSVGTHALTVRYDGDAEYRASDDVVTLTVTKASSKTSLGIPSRITPASQARIKVAVSASPTTPVSGRVTVRVRADGKDYLRRAYTLDSSGRVTVTLPKLKARTYSLTVWYSGSPTVSHMNRTVSLRVTR